MLGGVRALTRATPARGVMRAETDDVAFRLLIALANVWDGVQRASIDTAQHGLHLTTNYLGGYVRISAGPSPTPKLIVEWNESNRHLRVIRCHSWPGFESTISQTISFVREEAKKKSILESIDWAFVDAVNEAAPSRRTVIAGAMDEQNQKIRSSGKKVPTRLN